MGVFVAPLMVCLYLIPALDPVVSPRPPLLQSPLFTVHVVSMLFAYASFALACVLGVTYVLLFKEIKARHLGFFYNRLPSLQVLDAMNARVVSIGWLFLTIGIAVGGLWATQIQTSPIRARRRCLSAIQRFSSRSSAGACIRSRCSRAAPSAGAAAAQRGCRRWRS